MGDKVAERVGPARGPFHDRGRCTIARDPLHAPRSCGSPVGGNGEGIRLDAGYRRPQTSRADSRAGRSGKSVSIQAIVKEAASDDSPRPLFYPTWMLAKLVTGRSAL